MPRSKTYSEERLVKQIMISPQANSFARLYAMSLSTTRNDLLEQMTRNPELVRVLADFVEKENFFPKPLTT